MMGSPVSNVDFPTFSDAAEVSFKAVERLEALLTKVVNKHQLSQCAHVAYAFLEALYP